MKRLHIILIAVFVFIALPVYYVYDISTVHIKVKDHKIFVDGDEVQYLSGSGDSSLLGKLYGVNSKGAALRIFLAERGYALNQKLVVHFEADQDMDKFLDIFEVVHPPSYLETPWAVKENDEARVTNASFMDVLPGRIDEDWKPEMEREYAAYEFLGRHYTIYLSGKTRDQQSVHIAISEERAFLLKVIGEEEVESSSIRIKPNRKEAAIRAARKRAQRAQQPAGSIKLAFSKNEIRMIRSDSILSLFQPNDGRFDFDQIQKDLKSSQDNAFEDRLIVCAETGVDCRTVLTSLDYIRNIQDSSAQPCFKNISFQRIMRISKNEIVYKNEPISIEELVRNERNNIIERLDKDLSEEASLGRGYPIKKFDRAKLILIDPDVPYKIFKRVIYTTSRNFEPILMLSADHLNLRLTRILGPGIDLGSVGVSAGDIQVVIDQNGTAVNACYQKELKKSPDLNGKLSLLIKVNPEGRVAGVTTTVNTIGDAVARCVTNRIRSWRFPQFRLVNLITINNSGSTLKRNRIFPKEDVFIPSASGIQNFPEIERNLAAITAVIHQSGERKYSARYIVLDPDDRVDTWSIIKILEIAGRLSAELNEASSLFESREAKVRFYFKSYAPASSTGELRTELEPPFMISMRAGEAGSGLISVGVASIRGAADRDKGEVTINETFVFEK